MKLSALASAEKPAGFDLPKPNVYKANVASVERKVSKAGNDYLNIRLQLTDSESKPAGSVFYMLMDSDKAFLQWQASRFLRACYYPMDGEEDVDLDAIATAVNKADLFVAVRIEEGTNGYKDKAVVDFSGWEGFYTEEEGYAIFATIDEAGNMHPLPADSPEFQTYNTDEDAPF